MQKTLQELKTIVRDLIIEVGELKERVERLERGRDNAYSSEIVPVSHKPLDIEGEGYENLGRIYREGYHICPWAFGLEREGECLFCLAFMEKE